MTTLEITKIAERTAKNIENIYCFNGEEVKLDRNADYYIVKDADCNLISFEIFNGQTEIDEEEIFSDIGRAETDIIPELMKETSHEFIKNIYKREYSKLLEKSGTKF